MSCTIERLEPQQLFDKYKDMFSNDVLKGGNVIPESNEWYVVSLMYAMAEEFNALSEEAWKQQDARYACCDNLYDIAARVGFYPKSASSAEGFVKVTGTPGTSIPTSLQMTFGGNTYVTVGLIPSTIPESGQVALRVKALVPGSDSNVAPTVTGTIQNAPAGIDPTVSLYSQFMCGGADEETCEQFRSRFLERQAYSDSLQQARVKEIVSEYPCVTDVYFQGDSCCVLGADGKPICNDRVNIYALFNGTFPCGLPPQCVVDDMNLWLFGTYPGFGEGRMPFGICGEVLFVRGVYVNIRVDGLACVAPAQQREVISRLTEYVRAIPPSSNLSSRMLDTVVAQVVGDIEFSVGVDIIGCDSATGVEEDCIPSAASVDICGDITVQCDYKICINEVQLVNTVTNDTGCL